MKPIYMMMLVLFAFVAAAGCTKLNPNTAGQIETALHAKRDAFKQCYEQALTRDRDTKGNLALKLAFKGQSTQLDSASVHKSNIKDAEMKQCVVSAARDISLPETPNAPVEGIYDLKFAFQ